MLAIPPDEGRYPATLLDCYDGDTCRFTIQVRTDDVSLGFSMWQHIITEMRDQRIRLCDINAPEMPEPPAERARQQLTAWVKEAKVIELQLTGTREKFGRLLGWLYADGVNLNERMVKEGFAEPYHILCAPPGGTKPARRTPRAKR